MPTLTRIVCDFCNADTPRAWVYSHSAFVFLGGQTLIDVKAGGVAACAECRPFLEARDAEGLCKRVVPILRLGAVEMLMLAKYYSRLMSRIGEPKEWAIGDERAAGPRFYTFTCPRCNHVMQYDTQDEKRKEWHHCPKCQLRTVQVGNPAAEPAS
jgi:ssDNA-binding Zn-finger/Zn-ribbon topoisomerase 1